jgi:glycyl-tRNA synthetase beta chain
VLALAANELSAQVEIDPALLLELREFVVERLRHYYREQGHGTDLISAALASDWGSLPDLDARLTALAGFMGQPAAASLAAANKRIGNILKKSGQEISGEIDENRLNLPQERRLFDELRTVEQAVLPLLERGAYEPALQRLAALREPVDEFFDTVLVMDEDPALRTNRLALLARLKALFDRIADLAILG